MLDKKSFEKALFEKSAKIKHYVIEKCFDNTIKIQKMDRQISIYKILVKRSDI